MNNKYAGVSLFQLMRERDLKELGFPFTGCLPNPRETLTGAKAAVEMLVMMQGGG